MSSHRNFWTDKLLAIICLGRGSVASLFFGLIFFASYFWICSKIYSFSRVVFLFSVCFLQILAIQINGFSNETRTKTFKQYVRVRIYVLSKTFVISMTIDRKYTNSGTTAGRTKTIWSPKWRFESSFYLDFSFFSHVYEFWGLFFSAPIKIMISRCFLVSVFWSIKLTLSYTLLFWFLILLFSRLQGVLTIVFILFTACKCSQCQAQASPHKQQKVFFTKTSGIAEKFFAKSFRYQNFSKTQKDSLTNSF